MTNSDSFEMDSPGGIPSMDREQRHAGRDEKGSLICFMEGVTKERGEDDDGNELRWMKAQTVRERVKWIKKLS